MIKIDFDDDDEYFGKENEYEDEGNEYECMSTCIWCIKYVHL